MSGTELRALLRRALLIGAAAGLLSLLGWWGSLALLSLRTEREIESARKVFHQTRDRALRAAALERREKDLEQALEAVRHEESPGQGKVAAAILRAAPGRLRLERLDLTPIQARLAGRAPDVEDVASFLENLDHSPLFGEPELRLCEKRGTAYDFRIVFEVGGR